METPEDQGVSEDQAAAGTEQTAAEAELDESKAFEAETDEDKAEELGLSVDELEGEAEEEEEKDPDAEKGEEAEKAEKAEEEVEDEELDEELDDDETRGQELLDAGKKAEAEKEAEKEAEEKAAEAPAAETYSPFKAAHTAEDLEFFKSVVPENLLPKEPITVDGVELDFDYFQKENPEFVPAAMAISKNIIDQMLANNALVSGDVYKHIETVLFHRDVAKEVPKHAEIYASEDFNKWLPAQPETIRALMDSDDAADVVRVFNRFLNKEGLEKASKNVVKLDKKRKAAKKKADSVYKTTVKSKKTGTSQSSVDGDAEETEAFESSEGDDDIDY